MFNKYLLSHKYSEYGGHLWKYRLGKIKVSVTLNLIYLLHIQVDMISSLIHKSRDQKKVSDSGINLVVISI